MFETWHYRWRLWRLRRKRDRILDPISAAMKKARKAGNFDEEQELASDYFNYRDEFEDDILVLRSRYLHDLADKYVMAIPSLEDKEAWNTSKLSDRVYLSEKGAAQIQRGYARSRNIAGKIVRRGYRGSALSAGFSWA